MIEATACAKLNLSLRVGQLQANGHHVLSGLFQSVLWFDQLTLEDSSTDQIHTPLGSEVVDGWDNLAWRGLAGVRDLAGVDTPVRMTLAKRIPIEAGLGGGSADGAAGLALGAKRFGVELDAAATLAAAMGSDVPFCFRGGAALVSGTGEKLETLALESGYALGLVVPPVRVSTADVFARWDELEGPDGPSADGTSIPPTLRAIGPLINDLYPAATSLEPTIDDWRHDLESAWARPVLMTGSGPTLFAFFSDVAEAESALEVVPMGARDVLGTTPAPFGWVLRLPDGSMLDSRRVAPSSPNWGARIDDIASSDPVNRDEGSTIDDPSD